MNERTNERTNMNGHQPDVLAPLRALIAERRQALDQLEAGLAAYEQAFSGSTPPSSGPARRRTPVAGGSVPDRILGLLREARSPLPMPDLLKGAKATPGAVRAAVQALIEQRRLVRVGQSRGTKYQLAK